MNLALKNTAVVIGAIAAFIAFYEFGQNSVKQDVSFTPINNSDEKLATLEKDLSRLSRQLEAIDNENRSLINENKILSNKANELSRKNESAVNESNSAAEQPLLPKEISTPNSGSKTKYNVSYSLEKCNRSEENNVSCSFKLVSLYQDRLLNIGIGGGTWVKGTRLYDEFGAKYIPSEILVPNMEKQTTGGVYGISLIADTPIDVTVKFGNFSTRAKKITKLELGVRSHLDGAYKDSVLEYRNINI